MNVALSSTLTKMALILILSVQYRLLTRRPDKKKRTDFVQIFPDFRKTTEIQIERYRYQT